MNKNTLIHVGDKVYICRNTESGACEIAELTVTESDTVLVPCADVETLAKYNTSRWYVSGTDEKGTMYSRVFNFRLTREEAEKDYGWLIEISKSR